MTGMLSELQEQYKAVGDLAALQQTLKATMAAVEEDINSASPTSPIRDALESMKQSEAVKNDESIKVLVQAIASQKGNQKSPQMLLLDLRTLDRKLNHSIEKARESAYELNRSVTGLYIQYAENVQKEHAERVALIAGDKRAYDEKMKKKREIEKKKGDSGSSAKQKFWDLWTSGSNALTLEKARGKARQDLLPYINLETENWQEKPGETTEEKLARMKYQRKFLYTQWHKQRHLYYFSLKLKYYTVNFLDRFDYLIDGDKPDALLLESMPAKEAYQYKPLRRAIEHFLFMEREYDKVVQACIELEEKLAVEKEEARLKAEDRERRRAAGEEVDEDEDEDDGEDLLTEEEKKAALEKEALEKGEDGKKEEEAKAEEEAKKEEDDVDEEIDEEAEKKREEEEALKAEEEKKKKEAIEEAMKKSMKRQKRNAKKKKRSRQKKRRRRRRLSKKQRRRKKKSKRKRISEFSEMRT
eukprot:TRINITY_DN1378_c0_g1_i4.p2 TRINITY_DN1378_c0_g1~~TRINITY_DN1378_c0_g1_i4.p2  ORF type:complete len:471 (-),score=193.16 TRINITY_DN1378_c0_g1_i4:2429-3841(-)